MYAPFQDRVHFVAISHADRHPALRYAATIHHGIPVDDFPFDSLGSPDLLFFGRIHPDKGTAHAIEVARRTGRPLDIAGIIQDHDYFRAEVEPHLSDDIRYLGPVTALERSAVLGNAHALLHLIDFDEPFGYSVVEAMACGTPVIATRRGSMPELIDDGITGYLVQTIAEAIAAVHVADRLDRNRVRSVAVERFDVARMVEQYVAVYAEVLDRHR